jgi:lipoprotein signal peptidase
MLIPEGEVGFSLFSFALGVEFAQIEIVIAVLLTSFIIVQIFKQTKSKWEFLVGAMILSQALGMIFERI